MNWWHWKKSYEYRSDDPWPPCPLPWARWLFAWLPAGDICPRHMGVVVMNRYWSNWPDHVLICIMPFNLLARIGLTIYFWTKRPWSWLDRHWWRIHRVSEMEEKIGDLQNDNDNLKWRLDMAESQNKRLIEKAADITPGERIQHEHGSSKLNSDGR